MCNFLLPELQTMTRSLLIAAAALGAGGPLIAQEAADTFRLPELTVTATRIPVPRNAVPAAVTVITGAELRARGINFVSDALRGVPGAAVVQGGPQGSLTTLFLRGGEADYVKVLVDGVALNAPGGAFDFGELTTDNIERIEVVRGPVSVLYGSDAVAGVVHIFTRDPDTRRLTVGARAGTKSTADWDVSASVAEKTFGLSAGASGFVTDGQHSFNNEFENLVLTARGRFTPRAGTALHATMRHSDSEYHYPTDFTGAPVDRNSFQTTARTTLSLETIQRVGSAAALRLLLSSNRVDAASDDRPDNAGDTLGFYGYRSAQSLARTGAELSADVTLPRSSTFTIGGVYEAQEETSEDISLSEFGEFAGEFEAERVNRAAYAQIFALPHPRASFTAGIRHDDNDAFGGHTTHRVGTSVAVKAGTRLRASLGTAFKEPTFFENFAQVLARGNPDLRPEESRSWEAGVEQTLLAGRARIEAAYFAQRFTDMIQYTAATPAPDAPNYFNIAAAEADGIELAAEVMPADAVELAASYTHLKSNVSNAGFEQGPDAGFVEGKPLLRRAASSGSASARLRVTPQLHAGMAATFVGARDDLDFRDFPTRRVRLDGYSRYDATAAYTVPAAGGRPRVTLTTRIENLFDADYQETLGFPARGRSVLIGLRIGTE